jgi:hypothetical protein
MSILEEKKIFVEYPCQKGYDKNISEGTTQKECEHEIWNLQGDNCTMTGR